MGVAEGGPKTPVRESGLVLWGVGIPGGFVRRREEVLERWGWEEGKWRLVRRRLQSFWWWLETKGTHSSSHPIA